MLVLTLKVGGRVLIGDDATMEVLAIRPGQQTVRVGFDAPKSLRIFREEVLLALSQSTGIPPKERIEPIQE